MRALLTRCHPAHLFLGIVLLTAFVTYSYYRQRYVGAADLYGYYQQGEMLRQGRLALPLELPVDKFPSVVPYGYVDVGDRALPQYPPGFPLLIALAGIFNLQYFVTPVIGFLGGVLVYLILRGSVSRWTAAVFTLLWAFFPIVAYSSSILMSDMVSAVGLLAAWWLYRRGNLMLSAFALGFSFCVRPTNVLFLIAMVLPLWRDRRMLRYSLWLVLPCALYGLYNHALFGAPWRTGYVGVGQEFRTEFFAGQFAFYARETIRQLGWPLAALTVLGLTVPHRDRWFHVLWFVPFLGLYCVWSAGGDRWWWTRFLLPAYAALFFLAAQGFERLKAWMQNRMSVTHWRPAVGALLLGALACTTFYHIRLARREQDVWVQYKGWEYCYAVNQVAAVAAPGSYVGSLEFAGAQLLYTDLHSFITVYDDAVPLVREVMQRGREVYLLIEPWRQDNNIIRALLAEYPHERLPDIGIWDGVQVYRLRPPPAT
ncbi:MAG: hypothetical protein IPN11_12090 [Opitutaceae bacterium]|nr:hypothetical protein [Opitutaceae bacterium]